MSTANAQAESVVSQGNIAASEKAKETRMRAARAKASFLSSGLTLEGTPSAAIGGIFDTGLKDVQNIRSNANAQSKNIMSQARTQVIGDIMGTAMMASGSFGSMATSAGSYLPDQALYGLNSAGFGTDAYNMFELKDVRGY